MTRSGTNSLSLKILDWRKRASSKVVLPWSMWAMMAMLRNLEDIMGAEFTVDSFKEQLNVFL